MRRQPQPALDEDVWKERRLEKENIDPNTRTRQLPMSALADLVCILRKV